METSSRKLGQKRMDPKQCSILAGTAGLEDPVTNSVKTPPELFVEQVEPMRIFSPGMPQ